MISRLSVTAALFAVLATVSIAWAAASDRATAPRAESKAQADVQPVKRLPTVYVEVKRAPQR